MIRLDPDHLQMLEIILYRHCLEGQAIILNTGDSVDVSFPNLNDEEVVMDDLAYEHVQYQHVHI